LPWRKYAISRGNVQMTRHYGQQHCRTERIAPAGGAADDAQPIREIVKGGQVMIEGSCICGAVRWSLDRVPESATACNCTACRRYGTLWAYDYEGEGIRVSGSTHAYKRGTHLAFHFCPACGCVAYWRGLEPEEDGRRRIAVNLRLTDPEAVGDVPIDHFDGLHTFEDLPRDGRCVKDYWS
jgi:hypothetical protein